MSMSVTLRHNYVHNDLAGHFQTEIDLEVYNSADLYEEAIEEWKQEILDSLGYDEDAEDAGPPPEINYVVFDYDGIPESYLDDKGPISSAWEYIEQIDMDGGDPEVYWAAAEVGIDASNVEEAYQGMYRSDKEFAQQMAEDLGAIPDDLPWPINHIDWEAAARDLMIDWEAAARDLMMDYVESDGYYFRNM